MKARKILLTFGTRPEAIKLAPVIAALRATPSLEPVVAVTAQHRRMLDQVLELFEIVPDVDLDIIQERQTLPQIAARTIERLEPVLAQVAPDMMIVQGDTSSTFFGALCGFYARIPVAHVEAGLRTGDLTAPYPEELNRRLTAQIASLHFAPTPTSEANLLKEGVPADVITVTGNTVIDALHWARGQEPPSSPEIDAIRTDDRRVVLVTAHRRESWGETMDQIAGALRELALRHPELSIVFPVHRNPAVRERVLPPLGDLHNVIIMEPLDYASFAWVMDRSYLIVTDSGGIQEEGPALGKPVLVMRDVSERPEALEAGTVRLVGRTQEGILEATEELLKNDEQYAAMARAMNPYGDGKAATRIVEAIAHHFGLGAAPEPFRPVAI